MTELNAPSPEAIAAQEKAQAQDNALTLALMGAPSKVAAVRRKAEQAQAALASTQRADFTRLLESLKL